MANDSAPAATQIRAQVGAVRDAVDTDVTPIRVPADTAPGAVLTATTTPAAAHVMIEAGTVGDSVAIVALPGATTVGIRAKVSAGMIAVSTGVLRVVMIGGMTDAVRAVDSAVTAAATAGTTAVILLPVGNATTEGATAVTREAMNAAVIDGRIAASSAVARVVMTGVTINVTRMVGVVTIGVGSAMTAGAIGAGDKARIAATNVRRTVAVSVPNAQVAQRAAMAVNGGSRARVGATTGGLIPEAVGRAGAVKRDARNGSVGATTARSMTVGQRTGATIVVRGAETTAVQGGATTVDL